VRGDHDESDIDVLVLLDGCTQEDRNAVRDVAWSISTVLMPVVSDFETYHAPRSRAGQAELATRISVGPSRRSPKPGSCSMPALAREHPVACTTPPSTPSVPS
jgi:hypothetical protein